MYDLLALPVLASRSRLSFQDISTSRNTGVASLPQLQLKDRPLLYRISEGIIVIKVPRTLDITLKYRSEVDSSVFIEVSKLVETKCMNFKIILEISIGI